MTYNIQIEDKDALLVRRALGLLPHDEVRGLIENIAGQLMAQDRQAALPPTPTGDSHGTGD